MNRAQDPDLSAAQMQLLWVGNNEKEFAYLRDVLTRSGEGRLGLDRVRSPEDALQRLNQTTYDLLLCDYKPGDGMALRLLHEIRKEGPGGAGHFPQRSCRSDCGRCSYQSRRIGLPANF